MGVQHQPQQPQHQQQKRPLDSDSDIQKEFVEFLNTYYMEKSELRQRSFAIFPSLITITTTTLYA
jgi:hypothetical protein